MAHSIIADEINAGIPACVQPVYDSLFLSKNYNILILYYKYYCDIKIVFNLFIP